MSSLSAINESMLGFPQTNVPSYSVDTWGKPLPGHTNIGFSLAPSTKKRLEDILIEGAGIAKDAFGRVVARKEAEADRRAQKRVLKDAEQYDAITIAGYSASRQQVIFLAVVGLGLLLIFMSARR